MRFLLILLLVVATAAEAKTPRSSSAKTRFAKQAPCPSTGRHVPSCPGYVIDHVRPLCAGGLDHPSNMQWQTRADAKVKDREELRLCRRVHSRVSTGGETHGRSEEPAPISW